MMAKIDYRNEFQVGADTYEKVVQSKHIRLIYELERQVLERYFAEIGVENKEVMDFACGTGRWTRFLEKHFKRTTGVDISLDMLELARSKCLRAQFIHADLTNNTIEDPLQDRVFDVITAFRFYKNAEDKLRTEATEALIKHLKDGGLFIFDLHLNTLSLVGMLAAVIRSFHLEKALNLNPLAVRTITLRTIRRLFYNTPLEIIDYYGTGILPGRSNYTLLPQPILYPVESFLTRHKVCRLCAYNLLVIARKQGKAE